MTHYIPNNKKNEQEILDALEISNFASRGLGPKMQAISTILCPSLKDNPVVSVSKKTSFMSI